MRFVVALVVLIVVAGAVLAWWPLGEQAPQLPSDTGRVLAEHRGPVHQAVDRPSSSPELRRSRRGEDSAVTTGDGRADHSPWDVDVWVLDPHGRPVVGADVTATSGLGERPRGTAASDARGHVRFTVVGEGIMLMARKKGYSGGSQAVMREPGHAVRHVMILAPTLALRGVVRAADGSGVDGADVRLYYLGTPDSVMSGQLVAECKSDDSGHFELPVALGWTYSLKAESAGKIAKLARVLIEEERPREVELVMPGAFSIAGLVLDEHGSAAVDATVHAQRKGGELVRVFAVHGRFRIELAEAGDYELFATTSSQSSRQVFVVRPNEVRPHVQATLPLALLDVIKGRVVDEGGRAVEGAVVTATRHEVVPLSDRSEDGVLPAVDVDDVVSASDGSFALRVHGAFPWDVDARKERDGRSVRASASGVAVGGDGLKMVLAEPRSVIRGTVTCPAGHDPAACRVQVMSWESSTRLVSSGSASVDKTGRFVLPPQCEGRELLVRVFHMRGLLAPQEVDVVSDRGDVEVDVVMSRWGRVSVAVFDAQGAPVGGVRVAVAPPVAIGSTTGMTAPDGVATVSRCLPGDVLLRLTRFGSEPVERPVSLMAGDNAQVVVRLP